MTSSWKLLNECDNHWLNVLSFIHLSKPCQYYRCWCIGTSSHQHTKDYRGAGYKGVSQYEYSLLLSMNYNHKDHTAYNMGIATSKNCFYIETGPSWLIAGRRQIHVCHTSNIAAFITAETSHHHTITVRCRYNAVNSHPKYHKMHPIVRRLGRYIGCNLCLDTLIYVMHQSTKCCMKYLPGQPCYNGTRLY